MGHEAARAVQLIEAGDRPGGTVDESKRRFIKQGVGVLVAGGLVASGAKQVVAAEPPEVPPCGVARSKLLLLSRITLFVA